MKARFVAVPAIVLAGLLVLLRGPNEGRRFEPYRDPAGIWTVCAGITGAEVVPGRKYTDAECDVLEVQYVDRMYQRMGRCVPVELELHEITAWGDFAYNVGTSSFCESTAARLLREGRNAEACAQITRWRSIPAPAGLSESAPGVWRSAAGRLMFDCSTPENHVCPGLWKRRLWQRATCEGQG